MLCAGLWGLWGLAAPHTAMGASPLVPGSGKLVVQVRDDFEDPEWNYVPNNPKSSQDLDGRSRTPVGYSTNGLWIESIGRGHPDIVRRVETPPGGLEGSQGALLIQSLHTGVPHRTSSENGQDVLLLNARRRLGSTLSTSISPNCTVRVFLPPWDQWENRTGASFALRANAAGEKPGNPRELEPFWPGIFIKFNSKTDRRYAEDSAGLLIRAGERGNDYMIKKIAEPGWWTLGMSFTPDGRIHFFGRAGTEDLTEADHLASHFCYGFRCRRFENFYFDVFNANNGRSWSTPWVVDDPELFVMGQLPRQRQAASRSRSRNSR
jgi:hypothetical protein